MNIYSSKVSSDGDVTMEKRNVGPEESVRREFVVIIERLTVEVP